MPDPIVYLNKGLDVFSSILHEVGAEKVFIVTGKSSYVSVKETIEKQLAGRDVYIFNEFEKNPQLNDIAAGIEQFNKYSPDVIVAVGGGTAIDIAKSIKYLSVQQDEIMRIIKGESKIENISSIPLVVLPTTAGTGSEATHFSVIYIDKNKYSLAHENMKPDYVVLDPSLVISMPRYVAACTAFDALSQALESYWSRNASDESKNFARESINQVLPSLSESVNKPTFENKRPLVKGAYLAGKAIDITKTTAPHAISYSLTSYYGIAHGHAVASLLAPTASVTYELGDMETKNVFNEIFTMFGCESVAEFSNKWKEMMRLCGLNPRLSEYGIDKDVVVNNVNSERLSGHPVVLNRNDIQRIVDAVV